MKFETIYGATPIDPNEAFGLIPKHVQNQKELNEFEHLNISLAIPWAFSQKQILSASFLKKLHKKMFDQTWKWAGEYRKTQKNIGIEAYKIDTELHSLCSDVEFWIENQSFPIDEIGARFHHRLVYIHAFINGNGRHARLCADILLRSKGAKIFSWGSLTFNNNDLASINNMRKKYINALKEADKGDIEPLLCFVRL